MDPVRSLFGISTWFLRIAILVLIYIIFFTTLRSLDFKNIPFLIACGFALFGCLLFVGGFMKKSTLTLLSALMIALGCIYKIVMYYFFNQGNFIAIFFVLGAISLFFFANGNKQK